MYRALARFAQRWQGMLQPGRFVAGAGERGATPTRRAVKRALGPAVGEDDERRARRAAGGDARPEADAVLLGRAQDDVVRLAGPAGRVHDQVDQRLRAADLDVGRDEQVADVRVDDVCLGGQQQLLGQAADARRSRAGRRPAGTGPGGSARRRAAPRRAVPARSASRRATPAGCRPTAAGGRSGRRTGRRGGCGLRGPEGRRDVGVRSRGFHLTAVIRLCDFVFSRSGHPPRPAIKDV